MDFLTLKGGLKDRDEMHVDIIDDDLYTISFARGMEKIYIKGKEDKIIFRGTRDNIDKIALLIISISKHITTFDLEERDNHNYYVYLFLNEKSLKERRKKQSLV